MARNPAVLVSLLSEWDNRKLKTAQKEINKALGGSNKKFAAFGKKAGLAVAGVGAAAGAAAVAVGVAAGKMAVDFENSMVKIQSLVGLTKDEVDVLREGVLALSGETAKSPQELADGLFVVTSAGLRGKEAMDALAASAKAGAAGLGETNDIARSVAGAMSAYGSDVLSASAATDQIVATARAGNFETSQFAGALGRVLPFANQAGAGLDQVGGAVALLTRVNGDAAQSVTQMNALFKAFVTPTQESKKVLDELGLSAGDVRDAIAKDGLPAALTMLDDKLGGNREQLGRILGSSEAASAAFQILDADAQTIADTFGVVADSAGMTDEAFTTTADTTGFRLEQAFQEIKNALLELGDSLTPLIDLFADRIGVVVDIIEKLTPVIEPLIGVFMEVADVLSAALLDALDSLIPAFLPLVDVFSEVVSRAGPLFAKILGKVAEVLVTVLDVLVPLLDPLTDLVFGILEAAWPIIEVVVDVILTLVEALTPLLDAVMALLTPLGELIEVVLAAFLPVIEPLLPVIESLAAVLADVLVRAIGLVMTSIGMLIQAWSKLAPFVIDKVLIPISSAFLTWAEDIVEGAATAFGWVPGLGGKLNEAKDAISNFRDDTADALANVSETVATEGEKIGKDLVDQGVMAMTSPSALSRTKQAGMTSGESLSDGMRIGIQNGQIPIEAAARNSVALANQAARDAAMARSPSKLFAVLGKDLADGLVQGIKSGSDDVRAAMKDSFLTWFRETKTQLKQELDEAKQQFRDYSASVSESITGAISFSEAAPEFDEAGNRVGMTFIEALQAQATKAKEFAAKVKQLIAMDLSEQALEQVLAAGVDAGTAIADELIAGGATAIETTNTLVDTTKTAADEVGLLAANNFRQAGVVSAQETYNGFKANFGKGGPARKALMGVMDNLAEAAARDVRIDVAVTRNVNEVVTRVVQEISAPSALGVEGAGARGAIVRRPTVALIGEAGPEALLPLDRTRGNSPVSDLAGGGIVINVNAGMGTDGAAVGRQIVDVLKQYEKRNGPLPVRVA